MVRIVRIHENLFLIAKLRIDENFRVTRHYRIHIFELDSIQLAQIHIEHRKIFALLHH